MSLRRKLLSQFAHPHGVLGHVAGWILASCTSNRMRNEWVVDLLAPGGSDHVLENGCGPGVALALCLSKAPGICAAGVDRSGVMIRQSATRNREAVRSGRLILAEGSIEALPATTAPFDKAFCINVIQFIDDKEAFITKIAQRLKPGGMLAIAYQPRHANPTRADALAMADTLERIFSASGFEAIRKEELALKPVPAICVMGCRAH